LADSKDRTPSLKGKTRLGLHGLDRLCAPSGLLAAVTASKVGAASAGTLPAGFEQVIQLVAIASASWLAWRALDVVWASARRSGRLRTRPIVLPVLSAGRHLGRLALIVASSHLVSVRLGAREQLYLALAALAAATAFVARNLIRKAIAFSLMENPPFQVGDRVRLVDLRAGADTIGEVLDFNLLSITVRTHAGTHAVIATDLPGDLRVGEHLIAVQASLCPERKDAPISSTGLRSALPS
jgi:small-conductance mechanosensitive channel